MENYLKFARLFVEEGSSNGVTILKPETIALTCTNQLTAFSKRTLKIDGYANL
jgi:hypothetical protein